MPGLTGRCTMIKGLDLTICGSGGGTSALPAAHVRIAECTGQPGGMVDLVSGTAGGHLTLVKTPKGGIGEFVTGAGGGILNTVSNGVATYTVGTGVFTAGCTGGLAQFVGLPIMLNQCYTKFSYKNQMPSRSYEVLLRRPNGPIKRVIIDEVFSAQEARQTAASMYGLHVIDCYPTYK